MLGALQPSAVTEAAALVDSLLSRPELLLEPSADEARKVAKDAREFVKLFYDAAQAHCPQAVRTLTKDVASMVVDGFDRDQIWEELEVQNVPLRRQLRRNVVRMAEAPKGAISLDFTDIIKATSSTASPVARSTAGKHRRQEVEEDDSDGDEGEGEEEPDDVLDVKADKEAADEDDEEDEPPQESGQIEDRFLDLKDMAEFLDRGDAGKLRLDEDVGDSDFDILEAGDLGDDDDGVDAKNAKFSDFFGSRDDVERKPSGQDKPKKTLEDAMKDVGDDEGEEEEGLPDADEDLSDEEAALEAQIRKLQAQGGDDGEEDDDGEDDADSGKEGDDDGEKKGSRSLYEMDKSLKNLEDEVSKLEEEQMSDKHWTLKGEISGKERPMNSLLEVHLDQPMSSFTAHRAEANSEAAGGDDDEDLDDAMDAAGLGSEKKGKGFDVDAIIRQRIWDEAFDDVIRKEELPPSQRPQGSEQDAVESLNFEKSRVGLGDIYAKQYEAEMLGHKTDGEVKEDKEKTDAKALFAKVMFKLDQLTNAHFTPRPPMAGMDGKTISKVPSVKMEETIPLVMSDASLKAPEEQRAPRRHAKGRDELDRDEKKAARGLKKAGRRKDLENKLEAGQVSVAGLRERADKLSAKNKEAKAKADGKGTPKDAKKRLRSTELLSQAAEAATQGATRKEAQRAERSARPEGTPTSKKLKF